MKTITKGICAAKDFLTAASAVGIKSKKNGKKDVAIIYSKKPCHAAAVFTTNIVKAAPVLISQQRLTSGTLQAIVVNSGNANACTGKQGIEDAEKMCALTAETLKINKNLVAVASTGVIGVNLPMEKVEMGIKNAVPMLNENNYHDAALAIMTTDTYPKEIAVEIVINHVPIKIGGIAKGSGMIHPNMATTLAFITTDAKITLNALQKALKDTIEHSFNMITVDGDTSTNDCVMMMANGAANNSEIHGDSPLYAEFCEALKFVLTYLAKEVVRDGEGATKLLEMQVDNAESMDDARKAALAVCNSALVKTALFGQDANWGRILCALGYSGAMFDPNKVDLYLGHVPVMLQGAGQNFDEKAAAELLAQKEIKIKANLNKGAACAKAWGCDLSYEYVKINGSYRS